MRSQVEFEETEEAEGSQRGEGGGPQEEHEEWKQLARENFFPNKDFKGLSKEQVLSIQYILKGYDTKVFLKTGHGKTIIFWMVHLIAKTRNLSATVLVISPLLSLIEQQSSRLKELGFVVFVFTSNNHELLPSWDIVPDFIYMTPEQALKKESLLLLKEKRGLFCCLAIDECHCITESDENFRPDYKKLRSLRDSLGKTPIVALTATPTTQVKMDLDFNLNLKNPQEVIGDFNRGEIFLQTMESENEDALPQELVSDMKNQFQQGGKILLFVENKNKVSSSFYFFGLPC